MIHLHHFIKCELDSLFYLLEIFWEASKWQGALGLQILTIEIEYHQIFLMGWFLVPCERFGNFNLVDTKLTKLFEVAKTWFTNSSYCWDFVTLSCCRSQDISNFLKPLTFHDVMTLIIQCKAKLIFGFYCWHSNTWWISLISYRMSITS